MGTDTPPRTGIPYPVLRDGAISRAGHGADGLGFAEGITEMARALVRREMTGTPDSLAQRFSGLLHTHGESVLESPERFDRIRERIEAATIPLVCAKARIWMTTLAPDRAHAQWHVPRTILRNCQTLLGEDPASMVFVLRGYSELAPNGGAQHFSKLFELELDLRQDHRILRGTAVTRMQTLELGLRCKGGRYIFLARSQHPATSGSMPSVGTPHATRIPPMPVRFALRPLIVPTPVAAWDSPLRDLQAEGQVMALYRHFLREGPRILRRTPPPPRQDPQALSLAYQARQIERTQTTLTREPESRHTVHPGTLLWKNLNPKADSAVQRPAPRTRQPLPYPPAPIREDRFTATPIPALDALVRMAQRCPSTIPLFSRTSVEPGDSTTQVRLRKGGKLSDAIRSATQAGKAELILRGKVKPGRKVRVGGLRIEPAADGTFCVACVIRNGRLHVPVASVEAVPV